MAIVKAVCVSEKKGTKKKPVDIIELRVDHGVVGDAHAGDWHRQVSLLGEESIDKMRGKGLELKYGDFAENVVTEGIVLFTLPVGTKLKLGEVIGEVTQIGKKCHTGCEIAQQVGTCIMPKEGIFIKILKPGTLQAGETIEVIND
jgi:MOSC domain-containing protein YiiM